MGTELARIESVFFGREDHGILTFYLNLQGGSLGCAAGGYCLTHRDRESNQWLSNCDVGAVIHKLLEWGRCDSLDGLVGLAVQAEHGGLSSRVYSLTRMPFDGGKTLRFPDDAVQFAAQELTTREGTQNDG